MPSTPKSMERLTSDTFAPYCSSRSTMRTSNEGSVTRSSASCSASCTISARAAAEVPYELVCISS